MGFLLWPVATRFVDCPNLRAGRAPAYSLLLVESDSAPRPAQPAALGLACRATTGPWRVPFAWARSVAEWICNWGCALIHAARPAAVASSVEARSECAVGCDDGFAATAGFTGRRFCTGASYEMEQPGCTIYALIYAISV